MQMTTIELNKEKFKFSAGHFTIFSATERERLHGHNFRVFVSMTLPVDGTTGISLDYGVLNKKIMQLCDQLDEYFLLPQKSPYLALEEKGDYIYAYFAEEKILFLKRDVFLLPIANITLENLSQWFLMEIKNEDFIKRYQVQSVGIKIFSAPGQSASAGWEK